MHLLQAGVDIRAKKKKDSRITDLEEMATEYHNKRVWDFLGFYS